VAADVAWAMASSERCRPVGGRQGEKLLARIDLVAILVRQGPGRRHTFDVRQQEAGKGQGDDAVDIA